MNVLLVSLTVYLLSTNATMTGCNTGNHYKIQLMSNNFPLVIASTHPTSPIDYILDICLSKIKITNIIKTVPLVIPEVDYSNQHGDKQKQWLIADRITKLHILKCHYHVLWKEETLRCLVNTHREAQEVFGNNGAKSYLQYLRDFYSENTLIENCVMPKEKLNCLNNDKLIKYLNDNFNDLENVLDAMNDLYRESDRFVALMTIESGIKADVDKIFACIISFYRHYITLLGFITDKQDMDASNSSIDIYPYMQMVTAEYQNVKIAADNNDILYFDVKPLKHLSLAYRIFQVILRLKKQQIVFGLDEINNKYDKRVFDDSKLALDYINFLNTQYDESTNAWHLYALISSNDISMLKESHEFYKAVVDFVRSNKPDTILSTSKKVVDLIYKITDKTPSHKFFSHLDFDKKAYELFKSIVEFIQ